MLLNYLVWIHQVTAVKSSSQKPKGSAVDGHDKLCNMSFIHELHSVFLDITDVIKFIDFCYTFVLLHDLVVENFNHISKAQFTWTIGWQY